MAFRTDRLSIARRYPITLGGGRGQRPSFVGSKHVIGAAAISGAMWGVKSSSRPTLGYLALLVNPRRCRQAATPTINGRIPEPGKYDAALKIFGRRPAAQRASQRAITGSSGRGFILGHRSPILVFRLPTPASIVIVLA